MSALSLLAVLSAACATGPIANHGARLAAPEDDSSAMAQVASSDHGARLAAPQHGDGKQVQPDVAIARPRAFGN